MSYIFDRTIQSYIDQERERCVALVEALIDEPDFLRYCLTAPVYPKEIDEQRKRFIELTPQVEQSDDIDSLM